LLGAWNTNELDRFIRLSHRVFERIEHEIGIFVELTTVDEDEALSEQTLRVLSRCVAIAAHGFVATRYQRARLSPSADTPTHAALARLERRYHRLLMQSRQAARTQSARSVQRVLIDVLDAVRRDLGYLALVIGGQPDGTKRAHLAAIRVGALARRYAMLAAACLHLVFRLTNARKSSGLRQVAMNRERLRRSTSGWLAAQATFATAKVGTPARVIARTHSVSWVDEDDGYTSILISADALAELRIPRLNAMRAGVAQGSWILAEGTIRESGGQPFLEVGRVATAHHATEVWEDYLATQIRSAYDLHPRSLDLAWELPDLREIGAHNELHGRL
jgi:hypothetical protein